MRTYTVDLSTAKNWTAIVSSFNTGLIKLNGGEWYGSNWNAFHDYLSWPKESEYQLELIGWDSCQALSAYDARSVMQSILKANNHVTVKYA